MRDRPLTLPPEIEHPAIEKAAAEYLKLTGNLADAQVKLAELEENRRRSVAADREAHAAAIRAGKVDPGEPKTKLADAEILVLNRHREALEVAVGQARQELITTVASTAPRGRRRSPSATPSARSRPPRRSSSSPRRSTRSRAPSGSRTGSRRSPRPPSGRSGTRRGSRRACPASPPRMAIRMG